MAEDRWLIYALGGGLGHLTRALALARVARPEDHAICLLTNSPLASLIPWPHPLFQGIDLVRLDPGLDLRQTRQQVGRILAERDFDRVIVDTFPRGLLGELAEWLPRFPGPKILVHRDLNPGYASRFRLADFVACYDLILLPGESGPLWAQPQSARTEPWLILDPPQLLPRPQAREVLGVRGADRLTVVVVGSGRWDEIRAAGRLAEELSLACPNNAQILFAGPALQEPPPGGWPRLRHWPLLQLLSGVDLLVGSGGYNLVQEARATRTPLLALAQNRRYDRQALRLQPVERADDRRDLRAKTVLLLAALQPDRAAAAPSYPNGVHEAARLIAAL